MHCGIMAYIWHVAFCFRVLFWVIVKQLLDLLWSHFLPRTLFLRPNIRPYLTLILAQQSGMFTGAFYYTHNITDARPMLETW